MTSIPMSDVKDYYQRLNPEGHWFSPGTMRFFKTRLPRVAYVGNAGTLFVTRETNPSGLALYTVRRQRLCGLIETVGEFHHYRTNAEAVAAIKQLNKEN